jgi:predicted nucleic acid-binding protein
VRVVVADTGPLCYLVLIGQIEVLPLLFGSVAVPEAVLDELRHPGAPADLRAWASRPPPWVALHANPADLPPLPPLDPGERAAIALALALGAALLLVDDRAGATAARRLGLEATGTIGILNRAAQRRLLDLPAAVAALQATSFRGPPALLDALIEQDRRRREGGEP